MLSIKKSKLYNNIDIVIVVIFNVFFYVYIVVRKVIDGIVLVVW